MDQKVIQQPSPLREKRKISDSVLWQKPPHPQNNNKIKKEHDNIKDATKNFEYPTIADRLRTVSWSNNSHPTGVVKPFYERSVFPTSCNQSN